PQLCSLIEDPAGECLHLFGRTPHAPFDYVYRRLERRGAAEWQHGVWTPWERLPLDIRAIEEETRTGVHLLPVIWDGRLYLFWPQFAREQDEAASEKQPEGFRPIPRWNVKLAFSERENGTWSTARMTPTGLQSRALIASTQQTQSDKTFYFPNQEKRFRQVEVKDPLTAAVSWGGRLEQYTHYLPNAIPSGPFKGSILNEQGEWAVHIRTTTTTTITFALATPGDHMLAASISGGRLEIALYSRYQGELQGKERVTVEDLWQMFSNLRFDESKDAKDSDVAASVPDMRSYVEIGRFMLEHCAAAFTTRAGAPIKFDALQTPVGASNEFQGFSPPSAVSGFALSQGEPILHAMLDDFEVMDRAGPDPSMSRSGPFTFRDRARSFVVFWGPRRPHGRFGPRYEVAPDHRAKPLVLARVLSAGLQQAQGAGAQELAISTWGPDALERWSSGPALAALRPLSTMSSPGGLTIKDRAREEIGLEKAKVAPSAMALDAYLFTNHFHPFTCAFVAALRSQGLEALFAPEQQALTKDGTQTAFKQAYKPDSERVLQPYPREFVDFTRSGAYGHYNRELFLEVPLRAAEALADAGKFAEARRYLHLVFDPTGYEPGKPEQVFRYLPFRDVKPASIESWFAALSYNGTDPGKLALKAKIEASVHEWAQSPFRPHQVARQRPIAYLEHVFMTYIDCLLGEADQLFKRDTREFIKEATQLYVLAANLLGPKPVQVTLAQQDKPKSYALLRPDLDALSNALVALETELPFAPFTQATKPKSQLAALPRTLYFCIPGNDKLLAYWDRVAERLFNIRHCRNIEGIERELPLWEPPIDPTVLVRAVAAGVDIASVLDDLYAPLPRYRFSFMLAKALELCGEARAFGAELLVTLEKRDGAKLERMRVEQETRVLAQSCLLREQQIEEAQETLASLEHSLRAARNRLDYHASLERRGLIAEEQYQLKALDRSNDNQEASAKYELAAQAAHMLPNVASGKPPSVSFGGSNLGAAGNAVARSFSYRATALAHRANRASLTGVQTRRSEEWRFQCAQAEREIAQIERQIAAARLRIAISEAELTHAEQHRVHAQTIDTLLREKDTKLELYDANRGVLRRLFHELYDLAFTAARRAQRCWAYELGEPDPSIVAYGGWESGKDGLLSGERLLVQLRQLDAAYLERRRSELQLQRDIPLAQFDPLALIALKETGRCEFNVPEWLFDLDFPGHYFRRIKSVTVSIPCVVGPHTTVGATLTLLDSRVRDRSTATGSSYADDANFRMDHRTIESTAVSRAQGERLELKDERNPFEGAGAISTWRLELPARHRQFDYDTISEAVVTLEYTARRDGRLAGIATTALADALADPVSGPLRRAFSLRHEYPSEWYQLGVSANHQHAFPFGKDRFPQLIQTGKATIQVLHCSLVLKSPRPGLTFRIELSPPGGAPLNLQYTGTTTARYLHASHDLPDVVVSDPGPPSEWLFRVHQPTSATELDNIKDVLIVLTYNFTD
ncbi:MAG TPA: neuraminidase-like domain-containing protein, partial [Polyangiales bacterium]|nr:neuraminidase-like domain-containing protein [Polyangiales bacterium]